MADTDQLSDVVERFMRIVQVPSQSDEAHEDQTPSTPSQLKMAETLAHDLEELGCEDVEQDEHAYVTASFPASAGAEDLPALGLCAHIDTSPDAPAENVHPHIVHYEGGPLVAGVVDGASIETTPAQVPDLEKLVGQDIVCSDGRTLLSADDKAGVAEICSLLKRLGEHPELPHPTLKIAFVPDEEIGHGAALLDIARLGVDYAYTVDGGELPQVNYETFNAAAAHWDIRGVNVHPGDAKNTMVNACLVAMEVNSMLPAGDIPAATEGYEGFFHLLEMRGTVEAAELDYIIRDHDAAAFECRKRAMRHIEKLMNEKYGAGTAKLTLTAQYRNMAERLAERMDIVSRAERAIEKAGLTPERVPVRGGTDGAQLSFRGLLCPNIGTGGYCFHGPYEHITAEAMDTATEIIHNIIAG